MEPLLSYALYQYPPIISHNNLLELIGQSELNTLSKKKVIQETKKIQAIRCPECGYINDVLFNHENAPYYVCSCENGGRVLLKETDLKRYLIDLLGLFSQITTTPKTVQTDILWQLSTLTVSGQKIPVYYLRSQTQYGQFDHLYPYKVILYHGPTDLTNHETLYCSLNEVFAGSKVDLSVISSYIEIYMHFVEFTPQGDLLLYKKPLVSLPLQSAQYFFVKMLFENFGQWVSKESLAKYIENSMSEAEGRPYVTSYGDTIAKEMMGEVKKVSRDKSKIQLIFKVDRRQGYRIVNPAT